MIPGTSNFFLSQRVGRWRWPWLLLSFLASLIAAMVAVLAVIAAFEVATALGVAGASEADDYFADESAVATNPSVLAFELLIIGLIFWVAATVGSLIHGRPVRSLIEPLRSYSWTITGRVVAVQAVLVLFAFAPSFVLPWLDTPDFAGFGLRHLAWLVPLALATLIQTSGEDVYFKGYLLRQLGAATKVTWLAPPVVIGVFISLHIGNADLQDNLWLLLPTFLASEVMIIYLTMRTGGMEVAICLHWFNNFIIFLLIAERETQANELTVFVFDEDPTTITDDAVSTGIYIATLAAQLLAFTWRRSPFFLEPHGWKPPSEYVGSTSRNLDVEVAAAGRDLL